MAENNEGHRANWTSLPILLTRHDIARTDDLDATPNRLWSIALASRLIPRMRGGAENAGIESGRKTTNWEDQNSCFIKA
jgi:hypothetical protein